LSVGSKLLVLIVDGKKNYKLLTDDLRNANA